MPRRNRRRWLALCVPLLGCTRVSTPASPGTARFTSANPFASASSLLYQAPQFDRIHEADYQPALEEGMRQQLVEIAGIATDTGDLNQLLAHAFFQRRLVVDRKSTR